MRGAAEQQAALYEFTDALHRAAALDDVCDPALAAIARALAYERASILLLDTAGSMKFVAWRGLSESYRHAVEGHSPWPVRAMNPRPVCIEDIAVADLPEHLKDTVRREGIAALSFIPITSNGRLLGKFMTYYDRPHVFGKMEIDLALTISHQLGFAIERMRAEEARRAAAYAAQQLVAIVESSHDAIVSKDLDGVIRTWNQGAERLFGYRAEEVIGVPITIGIPPDRLDEEPEILARTRLRGRRDGIDAALELFARYGIRCVFATAHQTLETRARAQPAKPLGWVPKPYVMSALVDAVRRAVQDLDEGQ